MRWTVEEVARALGVTPPGGLDPWPGWPVSRLILAPWLAASCSSRYTDRVTMDTILSRRLWTPARWRLSWRRIAWPDFPSRFGQALRGSRHARRAAGSGAGRSNALGAAPGGGHRVGRKNHNERNSGGAAGRAVPRPEIPRQSEQRVWPAAALAAAGRADEAAVVELGMSHAGELRRLAEIARPECGRGDARRAGASGIFRFGGRNCAGQARIDRRT